MQPLRASLHLRVIHGSINLARILAPQTQTPTPTQTPFPALGQPPHVLQPQDFPAQTAPQKRLVKMFASI